MKWVTKEIDCEVSVGFVSQVAQMCEWEGQVISKKQGREARQKIVN